MAPRGVAAARRFLSKAKRYAKAGSCARAERMWKAATRVTCPGRWTTKRHQRCETKARGVSQKVATVAEACKRKAGC